MLHFDYKMVVVAVLFALLVLVKLLAGGKPFDGPVKRKRRFGRRGSESPLRNAEKGSADGPKAHNASEKPLDPEREFFGDSGF